MRRCGSCPAAAWGIGAAAFLLSGCHPGVSGGANGSGGGSDTAAKTVSPTPASVATASSALGSAPPDAAALWRRTLQAVRTTPLEAVVTDTRFGPTGKRRFQSQYDVCEGAGGTGEAPRFRLTYREPTAQTGQVVLSDGHSAWRFNPKDHTVAETAATAVYAPAEIEEGAAGTVVQADTSVPEVESRGETVDGRPVTVLAVRRQRSHRIVERRWIDVQTGRTLRMEQYGRPDAHLVRRIELANVQFPAASQLGLDAPAFRPDFGPDAVFVDRRGRRVRWQNEAERAARSAHLPLHVRGYTVRAVDRKADLRAALPPSAGTGGPSAGAGLKDVSAATHLLYSRGDDAISVFVAPQASLTGGRPVALLPGPSWRPATLAGRLKGFTQESDEGAAVAWAEPNRGCYIVVARMPLSDLLPVAGAFAADRDDAPATVTAPPPVPAAPAAVAATPAAGDGGGAVRR